MFADSHPGKADGHLVLLNNLNIELQYHVFVIFGVCISGKEAKLVTTSTLASFFSSLFAVAKIALIAFAVTSSPESEVTGQLPRYFTFSHILQTYNLVGRFKTTLNWTPSTIGSTSPGPESSSNSEQQVFLSQTSFFILGNSYFHVGAQRRKGIQKGTTFESSSGLTPSFLLPREQLRRRNNQEQMVAEKKNSCWIAPCVLVLEGCGLFGVLPTTDGQGS